MDTEKRPKKQEQYVHKDQPNSHTSMKSVFFCSKSIPQTFISGLDKTGDEVNKWNDKHYTQINCIC